MMDFKEVVERLKFWIDSRDLHHARHRRELQEVLNFIKSQQEKIDSRDKTIKECDKFIFNKGCEMGELLKHLSQLEETCPDCQGKGGLYDAGEGTEDRCETCQGSGKVPVCYLPDWFVEILGEDGVDVWALRSTVTKRISRITWSRKTGRPRQMVHMQDEHSDKTIAKLTKQPNNLWKLDKE